MTTLLIGSISGMILGWLMGFLSLFLILLVLIQRGKGGGLTGALGGPGGQSAFGSKAGDTFTVITVVVASVWGFTCAFTMWLLGTHSPSVSISNSEIKSGPGDEDAEPSSGQEGLTVPPMSPEEEAAPAPAIDGGESNSVELTPANAEATEPEATEPEATEPEATEPEATEPEASEPEATEPETTDTETEQPAAGDGQ
ncbi:preprotein translocase subunit SecG [Novipirellula aureliae]|uniref:Protein-export membrane protein SecG n=1 Tax=Novipirellula aureliae TaxID=2527966 RepID=A0A5C6ECG2_9BACT|nr:preprotein translocase subunit SecG [Novipirellula aureliae]TWU44859.1 preprotein translocase subunit SecG [Novipirellula aureliae]